MQQESLRILDSKKDCIYPFNIGAVLDKIYPLLFKERNNNYFPLSMQQYMNTLSYATAQAILDNISTHESGILIRHLDRRLDFTDYQGSVLNNSEWFTMGMEHTTRAEFNLDEYTQRSDFKNHVVYQTNRNSNNDRKVILIYGFIGDYNIRFITVSRSNLKIIGRFPFMSSDDRIVEQRLFDNGVDYHSFNFNTKLKLYPSMIIPEKGIMLKKGDDSRIILELEDKEKPTRFMPLGIVAEAIGIRDREWIELPAGFA